MNNIKELSIENIRSRMIKNAARIWGTESEDIESTFDPLVTMLIEACSFELSKINNEIHDSQSRILEQLAQVLSPDVFTGARPSYAIAHARASEVENILRKDVQFYAQQKFITQDQKEVSKDIYFSPCRNVIVFDTAIRYMAVGKSLYEYKSPTTKQLLEGRANDSLEPFNVWIAIETNSHTKSFNDFVFYFDWKNDPEKKNYLELLPLVKWHFENEEITVVSGIHQEGTIVKSKKSISEQYDVSLKTEKYVNNVFERNFFTIHANNENDIQVNNKKFPSEFEDVFPSNMLEKIDGDFLWVNLVFPGAMKLVALEDLFISLNSFPVINRRLNKITYQLRSSLNIVPLTSEETFFDLVQVQNSDGAIFQSNPLESGFKNEAGFYTLRYGGIERFDKRSASEFLQTTIDLLRDESASFSSMGNEFINTYINQINQSITLIENRLNTRGEFIKPSHFVIINPLKQNENVFIDFWSTNGTEGNTVKAGAKLNLSSGGEVKSSSLMLLTSSNGGKRALNENEKISAFRRSILTHDRIVSQEDIVTFCYHELGNLITSVEVKKAWEMSNLPNQGFIRIVEVHITPKSTQKISSEEWTNLANELHVKIEEASNKLIPLKIVMH